MGKDEELLPFLETKASYGTDDQQTDPPETKTSIKDLFVWATSRDKFILSIATAVGMFGSCLIPVVAICSQVVFTAAANYEQLLRQFENESVSPYENGPVLLEAGEAYFDSALLSVYLVTVVALLQMVLKFANMYLFGVVAVSITRKLRFKYVSHVLGMDLAVSQEKGTGELTSMLDENITKIGDALENNLPQAMDGIISLLATFAAVVLIRWDIGLILIGCCVLPTSIIFYIATNRNSKMVGIEQRLLAKAAQIASECFTCIKTVICFNGQQRTIEKYIDKISEAMKISHKRRIHQALTDGSTILLTDTVLLVTIVYGASYLNDTPIFLFVTILILALGSSGQIQVLNMHINAVIVAIGSAHHINKTLAITPKIELPDTGERPSEILPEISFKHVSFSYPSRPDVEVIKDFSLEISPGQRIAIVGESGCGKSTIAALLMRFFDPTSGVMSIDGRPTTSLNVAWLRRQFGFVSQEPVLFDMSIYQNVQCCETNATEQQIISALDQANAMEFVTQMEQGLDTRTGERGCKLSGGQRQRVAIARALLRKPAILVFDEATSSLDSQSEAVVQAAIDKVSKSHTTVTIAHRLSTILNAHKVLVMHQGRITEQGSPRDLANDKKSNFYHLLQQQSIIADNEDTLSQSDSSESEAPRRKRKIKAKRHRPISDNEQTPPDFVMFGAESNANLVETFDPKSDSNEKNHNQTSSSVSMRDLMTLHPAWKQSLAMSIVASFLRATRNVAFLVVLSLCIEALTYERDEMLSRIYHIAVVYAIIIIICFLNELVLMKGIGQYADELTVKLHTSLMTHFVRQNLPYFDMNCHESGTLSANLATHTANIRETLANKFGEFLTALFMSLEASIVALFINAPLFAICVSFSALVTLLRMIESRFLINAQMKLLSLQSDTLAMASEAFTNLETVKANRLENYFSQQYKEYYAVVKRPKLRRILINCLLISSARAGASIAAQITWLVAAHWTVNGRTTPIFDVNVSVWISTLAFQRVLMVLSQSRMISRMVASFSAIANILQQPTQMDNLTKAGLKNDIRGSVSFDRVNFGYPTRAGDALFEDLRLDIQANKTMAVIGPSGSGKSTILQLILRLYECDAGQVVNYIAQAISEMIQKFSAVLHPFLIYLDTREPFLPSAPLPRTSFLNRLRTSMTWMCFQSTQRI